MSSITIWDAHSQRERNLPSWNGNGERQEILQLETEFQDKAVAFDVFNQEGVRVAGGSFHGDFSWRDWPLECIRIRKRDNNEPVRLVYSDDTAFSYNSEYDCIDEE